MKSRIQKLPSVLWTNAPLYDKNTYVFYWKNGVKMHAKVANPEEAMKKIAAAEKKGLPAFASAPIPCNDMQNGVFAFTAHGLTKEFALAKNVNAMVNRAYKSLFEWAKTEPSRTEMPVQKIAPVNKSATTVRRDKDDPAKIVAFVKYDGSEKIYAFRCRAWHLPGEMVCVNTNGHKNVTVVECKVMKESEIIALANSLGYDDLTEVYCEYAIDLNNERSADNTAEPAAVTDEPDEIDDDDFDGLPE